jgi:hypothetical protein
MRRVIPLTAVPSWVIAGLILLCASYLLLTGSTVTLATIQYDELVDLEIAASLRMHPLSGFSRDVSQARFPMYVTVAIDWLLTLAGSEPNLRHLLLLSRWASIFMVVAAILAIYVLGARLFDPVTGMLAATLYSFSPYVLHYGRDALTQGDAFTPAPVLFTLIAFDRFVKTRNTFWLTCLSFSLALAIAAKFLLVVLIPALVTHALLSVVYDGRQFSWGPLNPSGWLDRKGMDLPFTILAIGAGLSALLAVGFASLRYEMGPPAGNLANQAARILWLIALAGILIAVVRIFVQHRAAALSARAGAGVRWSLGLAWLAILPLTAAMLLALFPDHIFNSKIFVSLADRLVTMDGASQPFAATGDSAKLYLGLILLKLGLPFGLLTCISFLWAAVRALTGDGVRLLVLALFFYGLMLAILPLQQPFYFMSVYPLLVLQLAAMITGVYRGIHSPGLRALWAGVVLLAVAWLAVGLVRVYPTFGYYGYELTGNQWLGEESRGYRKVIVVTNDGSSQAIDWLRQNAPAGATVLSYLDDVHIVNYLNETEPFPFAFKHAVQYADENEREEKLAEADFVVARVPADLAVQAPVNSIQFVQQFSSEPVFKVVRGRGVYEMAVIQIYQRQSSSRNGL